MSIATWEFESPPPHKSRDKNIIIAEIAQLVEHNLAKVGVAGPSPVFRSLLFFCIGLKKHKIVNEFIFKVF